MANNTPTQKRTFFNDEQFSDVIVKFGNQQIFAHKGMLASGSVWFEKALCGNFSEANKGVIELHDEDASPNAIMAMLRHLYGSRYEEQKIQLVAQEIAEFHLMLFILGDKYDIKTLREDAKARFEKFLKAELADDEFYDETIYAIQKLLGPNDLQLADDSLGLSVEDFVLDYPIDMFHNDIFRRLMAEGNMLKTKLAVDFLVKIDDLI